MAWLSPVQPLSRKLTIFRAPFPPRLAHCPVNTKNIMTSSLAKTTVAVAAIVATIALATVVKLHFFPAVRDAYFKPDFDNLKQVPAGIVVVRPSRTLHSTGDPMRNLEEAGTLLRAVGRNITFRELIAEAYDCSPGHVLLPADAPVGRFDFLVTRSGDTRAHLRAAILKHLGYQAHGENRDTDALKLTLDPAAPSGLTVSPDGESERIEYKNGKLLFKHKTLDLLRNGLESGLAQPVLDETGLTGRYNYSVVWNDHVQEAMHTGTFDPDGVKKTLHSLGLRAEPATLRVEMIIVTKAQ